MGPHHSTNEVGVVRVRGVVVEESARLDIVGWRSRGGGSQECGESSERLHVCLLLSFTGRNDQCVVIRVS